MARKPKIVLYQSQQVNQDLGQYTSYDILPLEMLHVGALPDKEGYEVVILDASLYSNEEAHRRALEHCKDAIIFGTTAILGYMVADGHLAAQKVRAAFPGIKIIAGGWFPSVVPEAYLNGDGVYDAVCMGQGELTFLDFVHAVESGADLMQVPGLALYRDGKMVMTEHRAVVGWDKLSNAAWHLIDIEPYRERQMRPGAREARNRMPSPPALGKGANYFGITYFSSFGCPEPCIFCCSPAVTNQRWKAMPAERSLDDILGLRDRWKFDAVRFQDANWGVMEKRNREFCEGLIKRDARLHWTTTIEIHNIIRAKPDSLDLLRDSGLYVTSMGAEAADPDMLKKIGKQIKPGDTKAAAGEMHKRGITSSLTYIIGYPGESEASMLKTIHEARDVVATYPSVSAHVYPFRPIPGNDLWGPCLELGYQPPKTLVEWGTQLEYHVMSTWKGHIPPEVERTWRLDYQYASFLHGLVRPKRGLIEKISEWRMRSGNFTAPVELKAFYLMDKVFGWRAHKEDQKQSWIMKSENDRVTMKA
ncbi:MAG: B12-binding domain-containing radical SAM protein [Planctomycetes bacterium]|nr:B12-binding domain-containing radical SAM protein [Planctomycetota bacterium]